MKGVQSMKRSILRSMYTGLLVISILIVPGALRAQQSATQQVDGFSVLGSIVLSVLHVPLKLVTCVGTQATAAVAYTTTYGVPGNYDGGTNGKQIGEVARRSCTGDWIITPEQVSKDYQN
jgi:predicted secreted Zn-dependent protease